jgi:hypothetical protein
MDSTTVLEARSIFNSAVALGRNEQWSAVVDTSCPPGSGRPKDLAADVSW